MMAFSSAGEDWAALLRMVADGNQMMEVLVEVFIERNPSKNLLPFDSGMSSLYRETILFASRPFFSLLLGKLFLELYTIVPFLIDIFGRLLST